MMNGSALGDAIWAAIKAIANDNPTPAEDAKGKLLWEAVGNQIVSHITTNAQVLSGIPVSTTGGPNAQSGVTTAPGMVE